MSRFSDAWVQAQADLVPDLLVVGSGAGGLSAAVTAAHLGLSVQVLEKEALFGGTTAWSGGWMWVPRNPLARAAGIDESPGAAAAYLQAELGMQARAQLLQPYLQHSPRMLAFYATHTAVQFIGGLTIPDFHGHQNHAAAGGRSVCAAAFDARRLGAYRHLLKPPLAETTLWGQGISAGAELRHCLQARHHMPSAWWLLKVLARLVWDRWRYGQPTRLVNGNALVAALAYEALQRGVGIHTQHEVTQLLVENGRVCGVQLVTPQGACTWRSRLGVVLASGGFPHDMARLRQRVPNMPQGHEHHSAAPRANTGDGLRLAQAAGAQLDEQMQPAVAYAPVSLVPACSNRHNAGLPTHFPHLVDRAKPGLVAVLASGQRFTNEANSYHDFTQDWLRQTPAGQAAQAWLIVDHRFIRYFGLGAVKPAPFGLSRWLAHGYLKRGHTLAELAQVCGINPQGLVRTIALYNAMASSGVDADFGKGQSAYNRVQGDAERARRLGSVNPCMAALIKPPFYAVRLVVGSLGTFAGIHTNAQAQALQANGQAVAGLYAVGNDMNSIMAGCYPAGGITLGPAMTFGFIAAHHVAGIDLDHSPLVPPGFWGEPT